MPDCKPAGSKGLSGHSSYIRLQKFNAQGKARDNAAQAGVDKTQEPERDPERMEAVLNQGLEFMSGLLEMATGQKLHKAEDDKPMLNVDSQTGEVTMKFKLPGF
jgi:hypothetical protein